MGIFIVFIILGLVLLGLSIWNQQELTLIGDAFDISCEVAIYCLWGVLAFLGLVLTAFGVIGVFL